MTITVAAAATTARRVAVIVTCIAGAAVLGAPPAAAHDAVGAGTPSSNYRARISSGPNIAGVTFRTTEATTNVELTNTSDTDVTVLDYRSQPYLRIGPDGVFQNTDSEATYLNRSPDLDTAVPDEAGSGTPRWRKISDGRTARWHDHRTHWMTSDPPAVQAEPDTIHVVAGWRIPVESGGDIDDFTGVIEWIPPPSPLPWITLGALAAATTAALLFVYRRVGLVVLAGITAAGYTVHLVGVWGDSAEPALEKLPILALPVLVVALYLAATAVNGRSERDAAALALGAAGTSAILCIAGAGTWLSRSQLPTALDPNLARSTVALLGGLAVGTVLWATAVLLRARSRSGHRVAQATTA